MHITRLGGSVPRSSFQNGKFSRKKGDQMDQVKKMNPLK